MSRRNRDKSLLDDEGFRRQLDQCRPEDFDGHTEFYRLTPEQRLDWLSRAANFVAEFKGIANRQEKPADTGSAKK